MGYLKILWPIITYISFVMHYCRVAVGFYNNLSDHFDVLEASPFLLVMYIFVFPAVGVAQLFFFVSADENK